MRRRLRQVGLVHAHFGDKRPATPFRLDVTVDLARLAAGEQILPRDRSEARRVELDRLLAAGNRESAHQLTMPRHEGRHFGLAGRLADAVGDVDREEVA